MLLQSLKYIIIWTKLSIYYVDCTLFYFIFFFFALNQKKSTNSIEWWQESKWKFKNKKLEQTKRNDKQKNMANPDKKKTTKLTNFDQTVKLNTDHMDNQQQ